MNDLEKTFVAVKSAMDWMDQANCRDMDVNLFFPQVTGGNYDPFAREVCASCPVQEECLWYANETSADVGMFGGLSPEQRRLWRKKKGITIGQLRSEWERPRTSYLHRNVGEWS